MSHAITVIALGKTHDKDPSQPHGDLNIFCRSLSDARRKLGFLGKEGYDIFGNNIFYAPRMTWQAIEGIVEEVKDAAQSYETAFNDIISTVENNENFKQVSDKDKIVLYLKMFYSTIRL